MADYTDPVIPRTHANELKVVEQPPVAQSPPTPEISSPMLDVHAPHEGIHTWRAFVIHIAAISVGLLLALGLERLAEYVHHRGQLADARRTLEAELGTNSKVLDVNLAEARR